MRSYSMQMAWLVLLVSIAAPRLGRGQETAFPVTYPARSDVLSRLDRIEAMLERLPLAPPVPPPDDNALPAFDTSQDMIVTPEQLQKPASDAAKAKDGDKEKDKAKDKDKEKDKEKDKDKPKKWYEKLSIRGYAQFRFNTFYEEPGSAPAHHVGDRSVGQDENFLIRRARVIISGDVSDHMYVYLQPDFASSVPGSTDATYFTQIRDWYADCYVDCEKVHRFRVGQSKVPYGWENLQSSSNRLPLDRNDALNSAVRNERDLGVFYYWTPPEAQDFFKEVLDQGLKGSGNYGVFAFGTYNGQGGSLLEQNENLHLVTRLQIPWQLENCQHVEFGVQAYTGKYTVLSSQIRALGAGAAIRPTGTLEAGNTAGLRDERIAGTFVYYPEPLGFQAEWTVGRGPALNDAQTAVEVRGLEGGYGMVMYRYETACHGTWIPFLRYNHFRGGYKSERNAPYARIDEWEIGNEWQLNPQMELATVYAFTDRTNTTAFNEAGVVPYEQFVGQLFRVQFQVNY